jgi:NAD(P)-dependent dehydrogenase (short-subunit alcohol dehydrogenase family)
MTVDLRGKTAIVTGGGRGIGRAVVLALARCGASVGAVYRTGREEAELVAEEAREFGANAVSLCADVANPEAVTKMVSEAVAVLGDIDILVNSAGVLHRTPFLDITPVEWRSVLATNLDGTFWTSQAVVRTMVNAGTRGAIVNITSVNQTLVAPDAMHYGVSKAAQWALTRHMAFELAPHGIRVNAVAAGLTETDLNREALADPAYRSMRLSRVPMHQLCDPQDQADAVLFLVSDAARRITGDYVSPDGGALLTGSNPLPLREPR